MKRNIKIYEKFYIENLKSKVFFLEITEQCNFLCIVNEKFLFDYNNLTEEKLNNLINIKNSLENDKEITKIALMPNRNYKGFSYSVQDKEFDLNDKNLKEISINKEFLYKGILLFEDKKGKIHLFTKCNAKYSDRSKTDGFYRVNIFNNKKGKFVNYAEREDIENVVVTLYGYVNKVLFSLEKIENNPINLGYKLTNIDNLMDNLIKNLNKYIKKINYDNYLNTSELKNVINTKYQCGSKFYINDVISKLSKFNLSNIEYLNVFSNMIDGVGHYNDINSISFSNKNMIPDENRRSFDLLDTIKI